MTEDLLVYEGIIATFQAANEAVKKALTPFRITPAQFGVLRRMAEGEAVSLTELALRLGCTNANVTRLVKNMVKAGLLEKVPHPYDRRVAPVRLSARGVFTRTTAAESYLRSVTEFVARLEEEERSAFIALRPRLTNY